MKKIGIAVLITAVLLSGCIERELSYRYKIVFEKDCEEIGVPECGAWAIVETREIHIVDGQHPIEILKALCHEKCCIDVQEDIASGKLTEMTHNEIDTDYGYCDWRNDWVIDDECYELFKNMMELKSKWG